MSKDQTLSNETRPAAENFSRLRRITLNLLKLEVTEKVGIRAKCLRAGWDKDCLLKVLTG
jgi:hypothetical protein